MNAISPEQEKPQSLPPQVLLAQMSMGFVISQAMSVACKLYLADLLKDGAKSVAELAAATGTHQSSLYRLMRALSSFGVFRKDAAGRFSNSELSEFLRSDHPESMRAASHMIGDREHWHAHGNLLYAVKTGEPAFNYTFGMPVFPYFMENPEVAEVFDNAMTSFSQPIAKAVCAAYDFSGAKTVADIGGGHGFLLEKVLETASSAKGFLFDQPQVVEGASVSPKIEKIGGDFFESIPVEADIYLMKFIIHDWNDEESVAILQNLAKSAKTGAKLLLIESVVEESENEPSMSKIMDLNMLAMTSGRERTASEYAELLAKADFKFRRVVPTLSMTSIVEAEKL